jgi:hypothetical protein
LKKKIKNLNKSYFFFTFVTNKESFFYLKVKKHNLNFLENKNYKNKRINLIASNIYEIIWLLKRSFK